MTYDDAKKTRDAIQADLSRHSAVLRAFPTGPMGLTPDAVKATREWRDAKAACDIAFGRLREFNGRFIKSFAKEIRAERRERCNP